MRPRSFILRILIFLLSMQFAYTYADEHSHFGLHPVTKNRVPHGDHRPRHGGSFFMAEDKFHHLEGVMASPSEFRIYFYNNYTEAIPASAFFPTAKIQVQKIGPSQREEGISLDIPVHLGPGNSFLTATIPVELKLPLYFTVRLSFPGLKDPELFNFTFNSVSKDGQQINNQKSLKKNSLNSNLFYCPMNDSPPQSAPGFCPVCKMRLERK